MGKLFHLLRIFGGNRRRSRGPKGYVERRVRRSAHQALNRLMRRL